ncbi:hypothetical protein J1N35_044286 [Gossypium stocksii]|uniref:Uncharacterized protein n=1 Tax=Gossypium stocksii TaxID=47602 RepID=A0A9D3U8Z4_9ROSI|nr:hypothetical protein J1N35_044286 [Gossypium stocksii]
MSEGVSDSMSSKGTSMVASSGCSEEGSGRVPTGDRLVAPAPRFKPCKVSVFMIFCQGVAGRLDQSLGQMSKPHMTDLNVR